MEEIKFENIIVQPILKSLSDEKKVSVSVLRLDRMHPVVSGNKWFKLKYYIEEAQYFNKERIISFGGAWSNHIVALACACSQFKLKAVGIIRGEEPEDYSDTLQAAKKYGMELFFLPRKDYQNKIIPFAINEASDSIIPEGGYGKKGAAGFSTALDFCKKKEFTHFICAAGTGTMMAGIIQGVTDEQKVIGISVLKNNHDLFPAICKLLSAEGKLKQFKLIEEYHFGGYAKYTDELLGFMNSFYRASAVASDFVYTGKLFYALNELLIKNYFPVGSKILAIHSGGLQGNNSLKKGTLIF
jgi:1-aminocyclopropane-1-carboxylate deaminase